MSYGFGFGFPRLASLAAAGSPFATLGPTLDLNFVGTGSSSGVPGDNDSLNLDFIGNTYQVGTQYSVWTSGGLQPENFQDIVTFSRASTATYYNSSGYLTTAGVWNYLTYSNQVDNAAWVKSASFIQTNLLLQSQDLANAYWGKSNCTVSVNAGMAPDGTTTANLITVNTTAFTFINVPTYVTAATAATNTFVMSVMAGTTNSISLGLYDGTTFGSGTAVIISGPGSLTQQSGSRFLLSGLSTSQWTRVAITRTTASAGTGLSPFIYPRDQSLSNAGDTIYVWGAQLVQGSVPGNYQATTTAALPVLYPDYNGALRARKLCENATNALHYMAPGALSSSPLTPNQVYSYTVKVKAGERSRLYMDGRRKDNTFFNLSVNLSTGEITPGTNLLTYNSVNLGSGWWQVNFTTNVQSGAFSESWAIAPDTGAGGAGYVGDGSSGIYVSDAQVAPTDIGTLYFDTTTYPYNAPRFDYDPVTLLPRGLLIEEQRTNLLLQSNDFQTSWSPTNITRTLNATLSPDGNINGVKIEATTAAGTSLVQTATVAATSATGSVYVKQGTGATTANAFLIRNATTATILVAGTLNYSTGVFTYTVGSTGVVVTNVGNGWWRVAVTATTGITSGDSIGFYPGWGGIVATAGDFLYAYGAQLEAGGAASSYIPTTTSQLTRAADLAIVYTLSPWFNAQAGTVYAQFDSFYPVTSVFAEAALIAIYPGGNDGFVSMGIDNITTPTTFGGTYLGSATFQASFAVTNGTWYTPNKIANSYKLNDFAFSSNGAAAVVDTSGTLPTLSANHALVIGSFGSSRFINGHIQRITYYPRRLSNTELQTLTTL